MSVKISNYANVTVLAPSEDLLGDAAEVLHEKAMELVGKGRRELVIDCADVDGFDSRALEILLDMQAQCEEGLGAVKLCGLSPTCAKILEITRLARRFELLPDLESAVRSFAY